MVQSSRTFRVFVSPTFADFIEECNALQREVFPKPRQLCDEHASLSGHRSSLGGVRSAVENAPPNVGKVKVRVILAKRVSQAQRFLRSPLVPRIEHGLSSGEIGPPSLFFNLF
jgi:hypothetical protein